MASIGTIKCRFISFVETPELIIFCSALPNAYARTISPLDDKETVENKEKFPFKLSNDVDFFIAYKYSDVNYKISFKKGFVWDGASIPSFFWRFIGQKGDPEFLIASMVHDKLCNEHNLIGNNRLLSSLIFRELLIACKVPKFKANMMFFVVDNFQKLPACSW